MKSRTTAKTRLRVETLEDRWVPVNPVNSLPGTQTVPIGNTLAFSAANGNGLSFTDPDGPGPFEVEVSIRNVATNLADAGTVAAGTTAGLTVTGNGTTDIQLIGDQADVLAALDSIVYTPAAGFSGQARLILETDDQNGAGGLSDTDFVNINVVPPALTPSVTDATTDEDTQTTSGLVISRNAGNGTEVTHFKITNIQNGTLFLNNGTTPVSNGAFITFAQANAGLKFTPAADFSGAGSFGVQASLNNTNAGLGGGVATATVNVNAQPDTPSVTDATTDSNTQTTSGLVISRNAADGSEVTHFKITNVVNGTLFLNDGTTPVSNGTFITVAQGNAGLKFTPDTNFSGTGSFDAQASTSNSDAGLGGGVATATVTVAATGATVIGTVFDDADNDGAKDAGEAGLADLPVLVDTNADGFFDLVTMTDANGDYTFTGLPPGLNIVRVTVPPGATAITGSSRIVNLIAGGTFGVNFGLFTADAPANVPGALVRSASGAAGVDIQAAVDAFRADLGTLNPNQAGSFGSGRREINWDGVPAQFAAPNNLPANFFNSNSPRGAVFSFPQGSGGSGFQVSGRASDAGAGQPDVRFNTLNATYSGEFQTFSPERLFTPLGDNVYDVEFFVPGTSIPAKVRGFGAVFTDVGSTPSTIELFAPNGASLGVFTATPADGGLSFLGVIDSTGVGIARVRITTGNSPLGPNDGGGIDVVALDDFIFGEPVAINTAPGIGDVANQTAAGTISVTVFDAETPAANLQLAATSSDTALFTAGTLVVGGSGASRTLAFTPAAGVFGTATITLTVTDAGGLTATDTFDVTISPPVVAPPLPPAVVNGDLFAVGSGPGITATVQVFNADGTLRFALFPFGNFTGGVAVATGDVTGDGIDDIAAGAGPGAGPHVKVFDGATGAEIRSFLAYGSDFVNGVFVGLGDVTGDGRADVVTGAGAGGAPHVKVFDGQSLTEVFSFFAFDSSARGGVTVRAGDVDGDGRADIVTGAGPGGAPHIKVFSGRDLSLLQSFFAADDSSRDGVFVGVANLSGDTRAEVVAGLPGRVKVFGSPAALLPYVEQDSFASFNAGTRTSVAAIRLDDGIIAVLQGAAPGSKTASHVKIIDGTSATVRNSFFAFDPLFTGGVFVG